MTELTWDGKYKDGKKVTPVIPSPQLWDELKKVFSAE